MRSLQPTILRLCVASVFLVAGAAKLWEPQPVGQAGGQSVANAWLGSSERNTRLFGTLEIALSLWLITGYKVVASQIVAISVLGLFTGVVAPEIFAKDPKPCGCFGTAPQSWAIAHPRMDAGFALARNGLLAGACIVVLVHTKRVQQNKRSPTESNVPASITEVSHAGSHAAEGRNGFTLVELMTVLAILAVLLSLTFAVTYRSIHNARRTLCASNLRQLGIAFHAYAVENQGKVPRYAPYYDSGVGPVWVTALLPFINVPKEWRWDDIARSKVLQCPSHPTPGIPTGYTLNCFAFESAPPWSGAAPLSLARARFPSRIGWLFETPDLFRTQAEGFLFDDIFFEHYHIARSPNHLPNGDRRRISDDRHLARTANVLFLDGHVSTLRAGQITLSMMDDGVRPGG